MIIKNELTILKKGDFFSNLQNTCPSDDEIEQTKEIIMIFNNKNEELTKL